MKQLTLFLFAAMLLFMSCSSKSDEDVFNSAKSFIEQEKYEEALPEFEKLINEYPDSKFYIESVFETGKLYHGNVDKNLSKEESLKKAVNYYQEVFDKDPTGKFSEKSLFMVGFIQANELRKFDEAQKSYSLFIEKFPESEMAESAKAELSNLGVPPEEILKRNEQQL